jgi:hypothetical protein
MLLSITCANETDIGVNKVFSAQFDALQQIIVDDSCKHSAQTGVLSWLGPERSIMVSILLLL